ncbi:hypothetical protein Tco_0820093 [Tanacetum coccineum]|uniref:Uncharacterized protein n=1 Tax=Tanacetum coccineum TaxID=301880 RepID=A0ABQ5AA53_9ASTR
MLESEAYKTYHAYATGEKITKPKYVKNKADPESSPKKKSAPASEGKRLKLQQSDEDNDEVNVSEDNDDQDDADNEDDNDQDDADNEDDDDQDDADKKDGDGQEDDDEQTDSENDGDNFVHPKFFTHDQEERQDEEDKEEEGSDLRVQTPSHYESTDDEESDEVTQGVNVEGQELNKETDEEEEVNELYRDVNINLEGRDTEMTNAPQTNVQGFISNVLNPKPDTGIDFILNLNTEPTSLVDVPVSTTIEMPPSSATTIPPPPISSINLMTTSRKSSKSKSKPKLKTKTSHVVAANLFELELKKILIDKMESNKSIHRSDHQKTLYKALVDAYESDKLIPDTYRDTVTIKRRRDDQDEDEEPSAGSKPGNLDWKEDTHDSFNKLMDTPLDFSAFVMNQLKVDTLTLELLVGPTFELMKGSCKSLVELDYFLEEVCKATTDKLDWNNPEGQQYPHDLRKPLPLIPNSQGRRVIPFDHFINNDLTYLRGGNSSRTYATSVTKTKAADYGHVKWIEDLVLNTMESDHDVYSRHIIIAITKLQIVEWHNYKHLDWITVRINDDKLYTFKEGDYKRLRLQDIEDIIVIQRRVEDLQLGVKSYQKKLNLTRPDTYKSDLKRLPTYSAYPNPRGFIYQNKDKKNKLMRIDEHHKFSDGTLNDVHTALDDILKRIRMKYLPQTYWKKVDKDRAGAMIQAIDKMFKNRRIMRSLEKIIGVTPFYTSAGNPVKEILLKLNLPDHRKLKDGGEVKEFQRSFRHSDTERLSRSDEVLKLKNFKKDATLKLFKSTNQERYEHVGPEVTSSQDGKVTRWRNEIMLG